MFGWRRLAAGLCLRFAGARGFHAVSACPPLFLHMCLVAFGVVRASESGCGAGAVVRDEVIAAPGVSSVHVWSREGW
jgi:hypothetical protein